MRYPPPRATALWRAAAAPPAARQHPADLPRPTGSANASRAGDDRLAVLFSESLDFERRGRPTADLLEEKIQVLLDPVQETAKIGLGAHIRRVTRRERGTVIGETEHAMTFAQQGAGEPTLLLEGNSFRRQSDALH